MEPYNQEKITKDNISLILKKRNPFSHKGDFGKAILFAGSYGKMGAATLAAKACLRAGVGLLTVYIPKCGFTIVQTSIPEAMVICDKQKKMITSTTALNKYNVLGIGCGIGTAKKTTKALKQIIRSFHKPMIIDADAITIISKNKDWFQWIPAESIFTPHLKEFERLVGVSDNENERIKLQIDFSKRNKVYVVLKGHQTIISCPNGKIYRNTTGNAGMAKGGSGDALTGILTAFLAQNYTPKNTCILGVYIHGLAGDLAVQETGEFSLLASDVIKAIGRAFLEIIKNKQKIKMQ
ncbi:NAD(P)H-hydrate dehydratase [Polaribacter litorisediminis]|uniref:NAD(P)H-hydrate dehydratase n=1 Tax=Polaribacter litorisediminis TaxID=1908341 RepID=UPI001CC16055|nr:NAD(P)H-hydrate dehydratase [Polaribacter litorisediminis]UAM98190.1 NAD(P)H-hydrate dehydratase [Polaribacter litorisediminis]